MIAWWYFRVLDWFIKTVLRQKTCKSIELVGSHLHDGVLRLRVLPTTAAATFCDGKSSLLKLVESVTLVRGIRRRNHFLRAVGSLLAVSPDRLVLSKEKRILC